MSNRKQNESLSRTANASLKECWWMQGGVVDYKLCDRNFDCEHCPFDQVLHGHLTTSVLQSDAFAPGGPPEPDWGRRTRQSRKDAKGIQGCEVGGALFYHPAHAWVRIEDGGCVRVGLDDFAVRILGRPYMVKLPEPGAALRAGEACWQFTHQAGVSVLVAPVSGRVKEINAALTQRPALLNRDPYGEGWVLLIEPTDLKESLKQLLYGPRVTEWCEREVDKLLAKVTELSNRSMSAGPTMNDGGSLDKNAINTLTADQLRLVIDSFFPPFRAEKSETKKAILVKHGGESG
jgi:glycine cleavage system H lipoate-binding protein